MIHSRMGARAVIAVLLAILGCDKSYPLGKLAVRVIDVNNAPVRGAAADLYKVTPTGKKVYWRASRTDSTGMAVLGAKNGGVIAGDYIINVSFISWHKLAPGETNDRPVTIKAGDDTVVTFRVVKKLPVSFTPQLGPFALPRP